MRVFTEPWVAISCGVPLRRKPPSPAYVPSVFSRTTSMSTPSLYRFGPDDERAQVHVEVELEPQREQQPALDDARRHLGGADRTEHHRVEPADGVEVLAARARRRRGGSGAPPRSNGHRVVGDAGRVDALHGLGHDLGADAVPADDPDLVGHWCLSSQSFVPGNEKPPDSGVGRSGRLEASAGVGARYEITMTEGGACVA